MIDGQPAAPLDRKELADTMEDFVRHRIAPGCSLQLAIALTEDKWRMVIAALRSEIAPSREAVLEEAAQVCACPKTYLGGVSSTRATAWKECADAIRALKNADPQGEPDSGGARSSQPTPPKSSIPAESAPVCVGRLKVSDEAITLAKCIVQQRSADASEQECSASDWSDYVVAREFLRCYERNC